MPLPKIEHPIHEVFLKSLGKSIKFRPFLVKEEKILLVAKESDDSTDIRNAVIQVLQNCCIDDVDIKTLPLFDIEMFFVHLRMKSIGEATKLQFTCENVPEESTEACGHITEYSLDLKTIKYEDEGVSDIVRITDKIGIKLKYPTMALFNNSTDDQFLSAIRAVINNIDYIYDESSVYKTSDISEEEILAFLDELTVEQIDQVRKFFSKLPKVVLEDTVLCKKCSFEHNIKADNLYNFFI